MSDTNSDLEVQALNEFMAAWRGIRYGGQIDALRSVIYTETPRGLDVREAHALDYVIEVASCRVRDLAQVLHVDASTATRVADRLVHEGLVAKHRDVHDGRGVVLVATPAGKERHRTLETRGREIMAAVLREFELHERLALSSYLRRLVAAAGHFLEGAHQPAGDH